MKYFNNITTAEELKKQFRNYCVTMHPDKGGDPEEFKAMLAEYEEAAKNCGAWTNETREVYDRQRISQEAERRAALLLTPEEFRALYGHEPQTESRAA